ncbi:5404_t:CDS:2, partial [Entrophospora sp. SA101]
MQAILASNPYPIRNILGINHAKAKAIFEKGTIIAQKSIQRPLNVVGKILSDFNQDLQEH